MSSVWPIIIIKAIALALDAEVASANDYESTGVYVKAVVFLDD